MEEDGIIKDNFQQTGDDDTHVISDPPPPPSLCEMPPEILEMILSPLSASELLVCCQVSRTWRVKIGSLQKLWQGQWWIFCQNIERKVSIWTEDLHIIITFCGRIFTPGKGHAIHLGYRESDSHEDCDWRTSYHYSLKLRRELKSASAWTEMSIMMRHQHGLTFNEINKLEYDTGLIAAGVDLDSDYSKVIIWSVREDGLIAIFNDAHITDFKFSIPYLVIIQRDGNISIVSFHSPGCIVKRFHERHFCLAPSLGLVVSTAGSNKTIKVWSLTSAQQEPLTTLITNPENANDGVTSFELIPASQHRLQRFQEQHILLSLTICYMRDVIKIVISLTPL